MNCDTYRQQLVDLIYGESAMTPAIEEHLATCADCAAYYASLQEVQEILGPLALPDESGFREVKAALREVHMATEKRKLIFDLGKFAIVLVMFLTLYYLIYRWQGLEGFAIFYLALYLILPLSLIPLQKWVLAKGDTE